MRLWQFLACASLQLLGPCDNGSDNGSGNGSGNGSNNGSNNGPSQVASPATDQPEGAAYTAMLPNRSDTTIRGDVTVVTSPTLKGVIISVDITGLPMEGGPFPYHIHNAPVPADGNCMGTLGHLDPFQRGEMPPCDMTAPQTCQVGDLSGKYGRLQAPAFVDSYTEIYLDMRQGQASFFGNRSITIHYANTTRVTCANFTVLSPGGQPVGGPTPIPAPAPVPSMPLPFAPPGSNPIPNPIPMPNTGPPPLGPDSGNPNVISITPANGTPVGGPWGLPPVGQPAPQGSVDDARTAEPGLVRGGAAMGQYLISGAAPGEGGRGPARVGVVVGAAVAAALAFV